MKTFGLVSGLLCLLAIAHADSTPKPLLAEGSVSVETGILSGIQDDGIWSFRGVPYAQPPVGELRWREPQPLAPWTGTRQTNRFGSRAMQPTLWADMIFRSESMSEDCLYLNVWTGAHAATERRPVLVYFHGGGFVAGDGSEPRYDGANLARAGIVVVTVNYRLGVFGFLSLPELSAESPHHASGNYGLLDQNFALRWVQRNIAAFGGDPARVTIAGQSAGSAAVGAHMASPLSRGLFSGVIGESGSVLGGNPRSLSEAEASGKEFTHAAGVASLADLRRLPAEKILQLAKDNPTLGRGIVVDGYFLTENPFEVFFTGRQADVPLLAGWNSAEVSYDSLLGKQTLTPENFAAAVRRAYGAKADELLKLYSGETAEELERAAIELAGDRFAGYRTWKWIEEHSKSGGQPVYRFLFAEPPPGHTGGAPHSAEIPYASGNLAKIEGMAWTEQDRTVSATMTHYWANFIKTGNPNSDGLPFWPWFQASIPKVMLFGPKVGPIPEPNRKRYLLLDAP